MRKIRAAAATRTSAVGVGYKQISAAPLYRG